MIRRSWLAPAVALALLAIVPALAFAARPASVTQGLDYLHSQQVVTTGGFSTPKATGWAVLGAVATGERMGSNAWTHGGKNPMSSLQATNHETAATASLNPPIYYSQMILAYMAGFPALTRESHVRLAGSTSVDMIVRLSSYQDIDPQSPTFGAFSPFTSPRSTQAVQTTSWAILALHSVGQKNDDADAWLLGQQNGDGGFGLNAGSGSDTVDTALGIQALRAGGMSTAATPIQDALDYLAGVQLGGGGFPDQTVNDTRLDADATAYAIQAIYAGGEDPAASRWRTGTGKTPLSALRGLQLKRGAYAAHPGTLSNPVSVTGHALVALSHQNFARYPASKPGAVKAFVYRPHFETVAPKGGTTFKTTRIVLIRATYGDGKGGTGINAAAVRLYVDNANKTKPADVGRYGLHLQLKNVANGKHTYKIVLRDFAGNERELTRSFTVAVPIATPTPTFNPLPTATPTATFPPPTYHPSTTTPTPSTTLYPTPTTSASPYYPTPTPTTSGSPIVGAPISSASPGAGAGGSGDGGGSSAGFLAGTLLAMLPLGAALSYYLLHRREDAMAGASAGEQLPGGGSDWERTKGTFSKSGDIIKPARS